MGNRAVITTAPYDPNAVGIYVHWNGSRPSIEAFLEVGKTLGWRSPEEDNYGMARLTQAIACFFGLSGLSVGIGLNRELDTDNGDNGTYLIGDNWKIVGRMHNRGDEHDPATTKAIVTGLLATLKRMEGTEE